MRKPHYWKRPTTSPMPSEIIAFDTETFHGDDVLREDGEWQTLRVGCALAYRLDDGKRTRQQELTFRKPEEFWEFVFSRMSVHRPVWVIGHNIAYDLGVVNGWKLLMSDEYVRDRWCVSGQMFYVTGRYKGLGLNFLDTLNYWHCALSKVGKSVGLPKLEMPDNEVCDGEWEKYCRNDVDVTARGLDTIIKFARSNHLGPFQPSIAGAAFGAYRTAFMQSSVLVHCEKSVLILERNAYYGGITEPNYVGKVPTDSVYELDVCSMYPAMCCRDLPIRYLGQSRKMSVKNILQLAENRIVFADVDIQDSKKPYPVKTKKGTYHATGTFRTALAHPELMEAIADGVVRYVHHVAWYVKEPIFKEYMLFFVANKINYHDKGDDAFENVCKLYATNLYGKTGQVTHQWRKWGREALQIIEQRYNLPEYALEYWYRRPPDAYHFDPFVKLPELPEPLQCRTDFGFMEIRVGENESRDSCPAIAAMVTSYARVYLRQLQEIAGKKNWYYSDTDSIWTNLEGYENLLKAGHVQTQTLGRLDFKKLHDWMHVYGPKDYETNLVCKRKGIRSKATSDGKGGWCQLQFPGALEQMRSGEHGGVLVKHVTKHLYRQLTRCVPLEDGFTRPLCFPSENPERVKERKTKCRGRISGR